MMCRACRHGKMPTSGTRTNEGLRAAMPSEAAHVFAVTKMCRGLRGLQGSAMLSVVHRLLSLQLSARLVMRVMTLDRVALHVCDFHVEQHVVEQALARDQELARELPAALVGFDNKVGWRTGGRTPTTSSAPVASLWAVPPRRARAPPARMRPTTARPSKSRDVDRIELASRISRRTRPRARGCRCCSCTSNGSARARAIHRAAVGAVSPGRDPLHENLPPWTSRSGGRRRAPAPNLAAQPQSHVSQPLCLRRALCEQRRLRSLGLSASGHPLLQARCERSRWSCPSPRRRGSHDHGASSRRVHRWGCKS